MENLYIYIITFISWQSAISRNVERHINSVGCLKFLTFNSKTVMWSLPVTNNSMKKLAYFVLFFCLLIYRSSWMDIIPWQCLTIAGIIFWIWLSSYLKITKSVKRLLQPLITVYVILEHLSCSKSRPGDIFSLKIQFFLLFTFSLSFFSTFIMFTDITTQVIGWCLLKLVMCGFGAFLHWIFT